MYQLWITKFEHEPERACEQKTRMRTPTQMINANVTKNISIANKKREIERRCEQLVVIRRSIVNANTESNKNNDFEHDRDCEHQREQKNLNVNRNVT